MNDEEMADIYYKAEHAAGDTRAGRRALADAVAATVREPLERRIAELTARANELPGLTATLDEHRFVIALVRECLAEHDAANGTLGYGVRPDSAITARIRGALAALDGKLGDYPDDLAKRAARIAELESELVAAKEKLAEAQAAQLAIAEALGLAHHQSMGPSYPAPWGELVPVIRAAAARLPLENELASTKGILAELHGYVAQMCEHFGDKREEVPCDAWRLRDHVARAVAAHDRLQTVVDERIGIEPVLTADELITIVERALAEWHRRNVEQSDRIASLEAQLASAREEALREAFGVIVEAFQGEAHERHPALFRAYCAIAGKLVPLATPQQPSRVEPAQEEPK